MLSRCSKTLALFYRAYAFAMITRQLNTWGVLLGYDSLPFMEAWFKQVTLPYEWLQIFNMGTCHNYCTQRKDGSLRKSLIDNNWKFCPDFLSQRSRLRKFWWRKFVPFHWTGSIRIWLSVQTRLDPYIVPPEHNACWVCSCLIYIYWKGNN